MVYDILPKMTENERIEFKAFCKEMEKTLNIKSSEKISWFKCTLQEDIGISIQGQFAELISAIYDSKRDNPEIRKRAIHVANFCMMIWSLSSD